MTWVLLGLAGGAGALARAEIAVHIHQRFGMRHGAWGTRTVNLVGAALLGAVVGLGANGCLTSTVQRVVGTGFLGGFTTFSTWMVNAAGIEPEPGRGRRLVEELASMLVAGCLLAWLALLIAESRCI